MFGAFCDWLVGFATWRRIGLLLAGCVVCVVLFAVHELLLAQFVPKDAGMMPDACATGYSPEYVRDYLQRLGPVGQNLFTAIHLTVDVAFPVLYAGLFIGLIVRLCPPGFARFWIWVPVAAALADLGENILLAYLAVTFNGQPSNLASLASWITITKWLLIPTSVVGLLLGALVTWWRARAPAASPL